VRKESQEAKQEEVEALGQRETGTQQPALAAFGLGLLTDMTPPGAWKTWPLTEPTLCLRSATAQAIAESWSGLETIGWEGVIDGGPFVVERGRAGDHRFVHGAHPDQNGAPSDGTRAVHHLSADASVLQCAPSNPTEPSWWRVVLDSVLFTVALLQGYEALHAGALAAPDGGGAIAITAASGGGKSTLLAELLGRGLELMADDVLALESRGVDDPPLAHPAPPLMTVPANIAPAPGALISSVDEEEECWIAVPVHPRPLPLKTLVILERRPGAQLSLKKIDDPLAALMGSLMNFPRTSERQRARFELASILSSTTTLWRLTADLDTPPDAIADTLLAGDPR
jgi:hypothetical protein